MEKDIVNIIEKQKDFQRFLGWPIDSNLEEDRDRLFEIFIFKMIEEAIELRKESPSVLNPWSKKQKEADHTRIKEEMSDVLLFFFNLCITWKLPLQELFDTVQKVQENNFMKIKEKKMKMLNEKILSIPGYTSGVGSGNLNAKYIFLGINPGERISHGYKFWSNPEDGSSKVLLPILDAMGIRQDCYFTNIVKCTTPENREPTLDEVTFWSDFLVEEINIIRANNPDVKIITMGTSAKENFMFLNVDALFMTIQHPSYVLRGGITREDYEKQIQETIAHNN